MSDRMCEPERSELLAELLALRNKVDQLWWKKPEDMDEALADDAIGHAKKVQEILEQYEDGGLR